MKDRMDGGTILFTAKTHSVAYSLAYLNENFHTISPSLKHIENIYAKPSLDRNSWFDYKSLLMDEELSTYREMDGYPVEDDEEGTRIKLPYEHMVQLRASAYKLSPTLEEIPACEYTDSKGYTHKIGARDGLDGSLAERKMYTEIGTVERVLEEPGKPARVVVKFRTHDIRNSIITVNGLFFDNYKASPVEAEYYTEYINLKKSTRLVYVVSDLLKNDEIADATGLTGTNLETYLKERYVFKLFKWDGVRVSPEEHAVSYSDGWFKFENPVDKGTLVFYNKVLHFFEVNKYDPRYVRIAEDLSVRNDFGNKPEDVSLIRLTQPVKDPNSKMFYRYEPIQYELFAGYMDRDTHTVRFPKHVSNALITYRGVHHRYDVDISGYNIEFRVGRGNTYLSDMTALYDSDDYKAGIDDDQLELIKKHQDMYLRDQTINSRSKLPSELKLHSFREAFIEGIPVYAVNMYNWNAPEIDSFDVNKNLMRNLDIIVNQYTRELKRYRRENHELKSVTRRIYDDFVDELMLAPNKDNVFTLKYPAMKDTIRLYINGVLYHPGNHYVATEYAGTDHVKSIEWIMTGAHGFDLTQDTVDFEKIADKSRDYSEVELRLKEIEGVKYKVVAIYDIDFKEVENTVKNGKGRRQYLALSEKDKENPVEVLRIFDQLENQDVYR